MHQSLLVCQKMWREHAFTDEIKTNGNYKNWDTLCSNWSVQRETKVKQETRSGNLSWMIASSCHVSTWAPASWPEVHFILMDYDRLDDTVIKKQFCLWSLFSDHFTSEQISCSHGDDEKNKKNETREKKDTQNKRKTPYHVIGQCFYVYVLLKGRDNTEIRANGITAVSVLERVWALLTKPITACNKNGFWKKKRHEQTTNWSMNGQAPCWCKSAKLCIFTQTNHKSSNAFIAINRIL